jgi:ubiquinone/menaquinone biosynthesis C-methylase UbiE
VIDALVECAEVGPASRVVDMGVGTGTGFVAAGLAPVAAAGSVVGADSSAAMLTEMARGPSRWMVAVSEARP